MRKTVARRILALGLLPFLLPACAGGGSIELTNAAEKPRASPLPAAGTPVDSRVGSEVNPEARSEVRREVRREVRPEVRPEASAVSPTAAPQSARRREASSPRIVPRVPAAAPVRARTRPCSAIRVELNAQPTDTDSSDLVFLVALTNVSRIPCEVNGFPRLRLEGFDRGILPTRVIPVNLPGPPERIVLRPGSSAFAGLKFATCDTAKVGCVVASGIRASAPGSQRQVRAEFVQGRGERALTRIPVNRGVLLVSSLQPSTQGVVAWALA